MFSFFSQDPQTMLMCLSRNSMLRMLCQSVLLLALGAHGLNVISAPLPAVFTQSLKQAGVNLDSVALDVRGVNDKSALLSLNNQSSFKPASIMKLVTTQAALELLGPNYRWITRVYADGVQTGDILQGNLVIEGSGDPRFAYEDLWRLLRQLRSMGLRDIRGNLVLDRSLFQVMPDDTAVFDGQPSRSYNAQPDALLLDAKALQVRLSPDLATQSLHISFEPPLSGFTVQVPKLSPAACNDVRVQLQPELSPLGLRFAGSYPIACGERSMSFHLHTLNHVQYFNAVFRALWSELGGSISGETREGKASPNSRELAQWQSATLAQDIRDINKYSNNVMARNLLLSIAAQPGGVPATAAISNGKVVNWLAASGIESAGMVLDNGSGLSREARISARTMAALLQRSWQQATMPEFIASLPVAGLDGTMGKRVAEAAVKGHAHIKTGSLGDVASIAGYVSAKSGRRIVVVCMINHPNANEARAGFDRLLEWIYDNY